MAPFEITARAGAARAGVIHTPHGEVRTPAFVPLASTATVKSLHAAEVAELGYDMVLGNTFHLFIQPGPDLVRDLGGLHEFMGWGGAIVTDSGGYQVFSMGHGSVAEEIKRRRERHKSMIISIEEEGVRFRSYLDGAERFMGPETSMEVQAALGSDIALAFDECTPFHVEREYTASSMERTHRWLDRCVSWHREHARRASSSTASCRAACTRTCARGRPRTWPSPASRGSPSAARSVRRRSRCARWSAGRCATCRRAAAPPARDRRRGRRGPRGGGGHRHVRLRHPTRLARHGTALVHDPAARWRLDLTKAGHRASSEPIDERCPCPACREHTRAYLHYLVRAGELTAKRLLTLHNLTFMERADARLREAIADGRLRPP